MLVKVEGGATPAPLANEHKEGDDHDVCPVHGGDEVEALHKAGGTDGKGEEYRDWQIFSSDLRNGGCGDAWSRTTSTGAQRLADTGRTPQQLTKGATRTYSLPSDQFRSNYERIFGHA